MNKESDNFEAAISEWRRKNGIRDDDSVLQMLELLKLFFQNVKIEIPPDTDSIQLVTVRVSLQTLAQLTKEFSKEARELTQEIRSVPKVTDQLANGRAVAFLCVAVASLLAGILIGKFLL
ncbi:MAG: hypothetical protein ACREDS_12790 [Limisphaerales bacterium]